MITIKILFIHNYYQQAGGEDKVVDEEMKLLHSKGHQVELFRRHNDEIHHMNALQKSMLSLNTIWSRSSYIELKRYMQIFHPDIVHFHNFFPLISPSAYAACQSLGIPVVQTLHNYRLLCPAGTFMRDGHVCSLCLDHSMVNSVRYSCYRNSRLQTIPVTAMIAFNRLMGTWQRGVDAYIVLTEFSKQKFIQSGIQSDKLHVKPNFISTHFQSNSQSSNNRNGILFVGRLSEEKGIHTLAKAWEEMFQEGNVQPLTIIGDGPEYEKLRKSLNHIPHVSLLGRQNSETVRYYMLRSKYVIVPSIIYEGFPMTIVEAYSTGTPVISSDIGSMAEIVESGRTGYHFEVGNSESLIQVVQQAMRMDDQQYEQMCDDIRSIFWSKYSSEVNYEQLMRIYGQLKLRS